MSTPTMDTSGTAKPLVELLFKPTAESIKRDPPRRTYLLTVPATGVGVLPAGKAGVIAAPGGTGKGQILMGLAVAVGTGGTWLGDGRGWKATPGRVLYVAGEEEPEELERRLHFCARAAGVTNPDDLHRLAENVTFLPLVGRDAALTFQATAEMAMAGGLPETARARELRDLIRAARAAGKAYSVVILDPQSRFAGMDVEKDNAAATRFVQVLESFIDGTLLTVLVAHHTGKEPADSSKRDADSADPIRGSSALKDAFRWAAILKRRPALTDAPELLDLRVVKTNYARRPEPLTLCRPEDGNGTLRVATPDEIAVYTDAKGAASKSDPADSDAALEAKIEKALERGDFSGTELHKKLHGNRGEVLAACKRIEKAGRIERSGNKWTLTVPAVPAVLPVPNVEAARTGTSGTAPKGASTSTGGSGPGPSVQRLASTGTDFRGTTSSIPTRRGS
jgi:RecA-family ATPase